MPISVYVLKSTEITMHVSVSIYTLNETVNWISKYNMYTVKNTSQSY